MSVKSKEELFVIKDIKLYGIYKEPLYNKEHLYYFQNLFVRGEEVKENFYGIKICDKEDYLDQIKENADFVVHMLNLFDVKALPDYDKTESYDNEKFILHGADAKALIFCGKIVAIGNTNQKFWIKVENFFKWIDEKKINSFKKVLVENKIQECDSDIKDYLICGKFDYEKYINDIKFLNSLEKLLTSLKTIVE